MKEKETVTMLPMEEIMKSVEQYVKEGKIGIFYGRGHDGENRTNHDSSYENPPEILY